MKKLAYDLCKSVPLLPSDYSLLVDGVKVVCVVFVVVACVQAACTLTESVCVCACVLCAPREWVQVNIHTKTHQKNQNDISCGVPEGQVLALRFLPHLPPDALLDLLDKGENDRGREIDWRAHKIVCVSLSGSVSCPFRPSSSQTNTHPHFNPQQH